MAKKKKDGKKGKKDKSGMSALEKETFRIAIKSLESKILARVKRCRYLGEAINTYRNKTQAELEEKEDIAKSGRISIEDAISLAKEYRLALCTTQKQQIHYVNGIATDLSKLQTKFSDDEQALREEVDVLSKKLKSLEDFRSAVATINERIQNAEDQSKQQVEQYNKDVEVADQEADEVIHRLKQQLLPVIEQKAEEFHETIQDSLDPAYMLAIRESSRITDTEKQLAHKEADLVLENNVIKQNLDELGGLHRQKVKLSRAETTYSQVQLQAISLLRSECEKQERTLQLLEQIQHETASLRTTVKLLNRELDLLSNGITQLKENLYHNEKYIKEEQEVQLAEEHVQNQLTDIMSRAVKFIKYEVLNTLAENITSSEVSKPTILDILLELFTDALSDLGNQYLETSPSLDSHRKFSSREEREIKQYQLGFMGILPTVGATRSLSLMSDSTTKTDAQVQTCSEVHVFDQISAKILSESKLLRKFEKKRSSYVADKTVCK